MMFYLPIAATVLVAVALYSLFAMLSASDADAARKLAD
jgi:hypothetical protein